MITALPTSPRFSVTLPSIRYSRVELVKHRQAMNIEVDDAAKELIPTYIRYSVKSRAMATENAAPNMLMKNDPIIMCTEDLKLRSSWLLWP